MFLFCENEVFRRSIRELGTLVISGCRLIEADAISLDFNLIDQNLIRKLECEGKLRTNTKFGLEFDCSVKSRNNLISNN